MNSDRRPAARRERGAVAILVAVSLFALLGAGAFALDFGRWLVVKNELQNASDASAPPGAIFFRRWRRTDLAQAVAVGDLANPMNSSEKIALSRGTSFRDTGFQESRLRPHPGRRDQR